jgi:MFS family permease
LTTARERSDDPDRASRMRRCRSSRPGPVEEDDVDETPAAHQVADGSRTRSAVRKSALRLLPFLGLLYLINYLDRTNVGFAALTMNADLGLSAAAYGLGAGLFFVGYFVFEVPSNILLHRLGARVWIARIMVSWGVVASAMAFIQDEISFYVLRVLLGIAEAGFFPGIILYLTYWFPRAQRARMIALFLLAAPLSSVIGAPISTLLIENGDGMLGFAQGWRFMYFVEGLPAILLGVVVFFLLPSRPRDARWLTAAEATALESDIAAEDRREVGREISAWSALTDPRVLVLSFVYFGVSFGFTVLGFFLPLMVEGFQSQFGVTYTLTEIGLITAIPSAVGAVVMFFWARHSDRTGERRLHVAIPAIVGALAVGPALYMDSPLLVMLFMTVCAVGAFAAIPPLWQIPETLLIGVGAAAGIGLINSLGNLSGFVGAYLIGWLQDLSGSLQPGMWVSAAFMALAGIAVLGVRRPTPRPVPATAAEPLAGAPE